MKSSVTSRFVHCYEMLRSQGHVRSARQFAQALEFYPQSWNEVLKGRRNVTLVLIERAVEEFGFNPDYLFTGQGVEFKSNKTSDGLRVLTVVMDQEGKENILHVPSVAKAGYVLDADRLDPVDTMMSYTIPGMDHRFSTFRSFEVSGDSMVPSLEDGDVVICQYIEPSFWTKQVKEDHVYVVVTDEDIVVKRVKNRLDDQQALHLISDNVTYETVFLHADRIREIWHVERLIKGFDHSTTISLKTASSPQLDELLRLQSALLEQMGSR